MALSLDNLKLTSALGRPSSQEDLNRLHELDWKSFEDFVLAVFKAIYEPHKIDVIHTEYTGDGGRDGWAEAVIGPANIASIDQPVFRLWIEAKKRREGKLIDLPDVGGHVILALLQNVNQLVIVTNVDFRSRVRKTLVELGKRNNLSVSLLSGIDLVLEACKHGVALPGKASAEEGECERIAGQQRKQRPKSNQLDLQVSFSPDPFLLDDFTVGGRLTVDAGTSAFLILDINLRGGSGATEIELEVRPKNPEEIDVAPYLCPTGLLLARNSYARIAFMLWPRADKVYTYEDFEITCSKPRATSIHAEGRGEFIVRQGILPTWAPPKRLRLLESIKDQINAWLKEGGLRSITIKAGAGVGKSMFLSNLRRHWLSRGGRELYLDGAIHTTVESIIERVTTCLLPLPLSLAQSQSEESITEWLSAAGLETTTTASLLTELIKGGFKLNRCTLTLSQIGELLTLLLAKASGSRPLIFVFEDLHKVDPSVLTLLVDIRRFAAYLRECHLFIITTSRPEPVHIDQDTSIHWLSQQQVYADSELATTVTLSNFSYSEALELIQRTIPTIDVESAEQIIQQVGRSPFAIKESILYMLAAEIVEFDKHLRQLIVAAPERLRERIRAHQFEKTTELKISCIRGRHGAWLGDMIDAAACLGRYFDLLPCIEVAGNPSRTEMDIALRECELYEIFKPSDIYPHLSEFDHDIIRLKILENIGDYRRKKIARALYQELAEKSDPITAASLAYQAGLAKEALKWASIDTAQSLNLGHYSDAVRGTFLRLLILDKGGDWHSELMASPHVRWDDAIKTATPSYATFDTRLEYYEKVATVIREALEQMELVGSIAAPISDKLISSGRMLSSALNDASAEADLLFFEGRVLFDRNSLAQARDIFRQGEELLLGNPNARSRRATNSMWISFVERHLGNTEGSLLAMQNSLRLRGKADWGLLGRIIANMGALYLHTDIKKTRHYWQHGLEVMERRQSEEARRHHVHFLTNVVHLDILDGNFEAAESRLLYSMGLARKLGLQGELIRCLIQGGCLEICRAGNLALADRYFHDAERLAISQGSFRKLWRIRANLATIREKQTQWDKAYVHDLSVARNMPPIINQEAPDGTSVEMWRRTRATCALINIALRSRINEKYQGILDILHPQALRVAVDCADALLSPELDQGQHIGGLLVFMRRIGNWPRFAITD